MDRIGEPFRSAERIRDALRNDRILVVSRIADKGPAVAKSLAEKFGRSPVPLSAIRHCCATG